MNKDYWGKDKYFKIIVLNWIFNSLLDSLGVIWLEPEVVSKVE